MKTNYERTIKILFTIEVVLVSILVLGAIGKILFPSFWLYQPVSKTENHKVIKINNDNVENCDTIMIRIVK